MVDHIKNMKNEIEENVQTNQHCHNPLGAI
jgi:isopropylmalate/homocitrate/citramalate synthase